MEIIEKLKLSDLSVEEFATLCGVSRTVVYNWGKGGAIHPLRKPKVTKLLAAIVAAVGAGDMPVKAPKTRNNPDAKILRDGEIKAVIIKHLRNLPVTA